jgi:hypothetical protein
MNPCPKEDVKCPQLPRNGNNVEALRDEDYEISKHKGNILFCTLENKARS